MAVINLTALLSKHLGLKDITDPEQLKKLDPKKLAALKADMKKVIEALGTKPPKGKA